ncbi:TPA: hypothetical protein PXM28_003425 [Yersinia enterocolitica]|nr:hypothetical protein [Yersinia enterocolitica]
MSITIKSQSGVLTKASTESEKIHAKYKPDTLSMADAGLTSLTHLSNISNGLIASIPLRSPTKELSEDNKAKMKEEMMHILDNINKLSPAIMTMLVKIIEAFNESNTATGKYLSCLTLLSRDLIVNTSDSVKEQGKKQMISSIVGGAASAIGSTIATMTSFKGINKQSEAAAIKDPGAAVPKEALLTSAQKFMSASQVSHVAGAAAKGLIEGTTANAIHIDMSEQKMSEQEASVTQSLKDTASQETEKVKELKEFLLRLVQTIVDDTKQARDVAAMGCKI